MPDEVRTLEADFRRIVRLDDQKEYTAALRRSRIPCSMTGIVVWMRQVSMKIRGRMDGVCKNETRLHEKGSSH